MSNILSEHFYHKTVHTYSAVFGTVFSKLKIRRDNNRIIQVPIAYAAQQKYNARLDQDEDPDLVRYMKRTPRMSFQLVSMNRSPERNKNKMYQLSSRDTIGITANGVKTQYNRVPFVFGYTLNITTKYLDDMFQILEQIMVSFNPSLQVVVNDNPDLEQDSSIVITPVGNSLQDSYEGLYENGREITVEIQFELEGYLYMPTSEQGLIQTIHLNYNDLDTLDKIDDDVITEDDL